VEQGASFKTALQAEERGQAPEKEATADSKTGLPGKGEAMEEEGNPLAGIFSGESILRSMSGHNAVNQAEPAVAPSEGAAAAENLISEMAERILVSEADKSSNTAEVRINIKNSVLPDTEIILRREGDRLNVLLLTASAASHHTLLEAAPALRELLLKQDSRKEEDLSVEVALQDGRQDDGRERRSRGLDYLNGVER
jgi:type III secretion system needle length determinant